MAGLKRQVFSTCWPICTAPPDVDFLLDRVPGHPNCVCLVGATHAFKFASVIGRTATELLHRGKTKTCYDYSINLTFLQLSLTNADMDCIHEQQTVT